MTDQPDDIDKVKESIDRERTNLLTTVAALSFLVVCLVVSNIAVGAYSLSAVNEREAVSIALDDQRLQHYSCIRDEERTEDCAQSLVSPSSRDIKRDLESSGYAEIIYSEGTISRADRNIEEDQEPRREAFGLLGYIIY